jgi:hypothetical protein
MVKYDLYPNPNGTGYLIDIQAELFDNFSSRIVVFLFPVNEAPKPAKRSILCLILMRKSCHVDTTPRFCPGRGQQ